jgi:predicted metal-dependent HD superfamily phosphohydrolase
MTTHDELVDAAVTAAGLPARYAQAHRHYHSLEHVQHVIRCIDELEPAADDVTALVLAAWFHDAIYAPGRHDNEERSAFLAKDTLEVIGASPALQTEVARLVLLTATHDPVPEDYAGAVLSDADLSVLGSSPDDYRRYTNAIREEYSLVPDDEFRLGRATILRTFAERPTLFHTEAGRARWEGTARRNLGAEIAELERAPA